MPFSQIAYLDYAASAPIRKCALNAEAAYDSAPYAGANPNSLHTLGRLAARALDEARKTIANSLGTSFRPQDVIFTSGGTESNNLAVFGLSQGIRATKGNKNRIILSAIEHDSILDCETELKHRGFEVSYVYPSRQGYIESSALLELLGPDVCLVSIMAANNETGAIQDISALSECAHKAGALFHTDAVQAFCKAPLDYTCVDAVSISAHKLGGPVGVGALVLNGRQAVFPQSFGGKQERGLRAGTQDVRSALAFSAVVQEAQELFEERYTQTKKCAELLLGELNLHDKIQLTIERNSNHNVLPGIVHIMVKGMDSQTLVLALDNAGYATSGGSACSAQSAEPSHVLIAMGIPKSEAISSLRISFDERVSRDTLSSFACALKNIVQSRG